MDEIHSARLFSLREEGDGRVVVVLAPRPVSPAVAGANVRVAGTFRRLGVAELRRTPGWSGIDSETRRRLADRPVLVATAVLAATEAAAPCAPAEEPKAEEPPPQEKREAEFPTPAATVPSPLAMRASTLVAHVDGFAGRPIRLLNARVVGVLEPQALLVEPATEYLKTMGERDRILVLIENAQLDVEAATLVGNTITVEGTARTLLGMKVAREVPWPERLSPKVVDRLEVRAAILARSVQTAEGIELTARR